MYGYHTGGVNGLRRFSRCLACAIAKPGKCGAGFAAWFCRRRLSTLDTRALPLDEKTKALQDGVPLLPSRSVGYVLARGLDAAGRPQSCKALATNPQPEEDKLLSMWDRTTWSAANPRQPSDNDKSQTFVLQAAILMKNIQGMKAEEQYREINCACTKRYIGCLKRLAGMDSSRRKREQRAEVESARQPSLPSMMEEDLRHTGLRRWPDYGFLCGDEADVLMSRELVCYSPCFINAQTLSWREEMAPCSYGLPAWHLHHGFLTEANTM